MAIVFSKDISTNKLLMAYNNNVVRFRSDSGLNPQTAQITGLGIDVVLYPHPNGNFYFNFKDYVVSEINTKNFADTIATNLLATFPDSFTYDCSDGCYLEDIVFFKINFTNTTFETTTRTLRFIAGVEQLEDYKKNEVLFSSSQFCVLSPMQDASNNTSYLKYWEGYPFEFSFYNLDFETVPNFTLKNRQNGLSNTFNSKSKVSSFFVCDGDITTHEILPLANGLNELQFLVNGVNKNVNLIIDKVDSDCGVYIKFLNKYGRFNYWLLSKNHFRNRSSKYLGEIENDFNNLEDTNSPTIQTGKAGDEILRCAAEKLNENEKLILEGIIDSPKIYLFTGERFSKADLTDWMEVRLKTSSFTVKAPKKKLYSYFVEFDLPARNTQTL
jgi:hypothetical protein